MSNKAYRFITFGLIVLLMIMAFRVVMLDHRVSEMERQVGEDLAKTVLMLADINLLIAQQLNMETPDVERLRDYLHISYMLSSQSQLPALAYYFEIMFVEMEKTRLIEEFDWERITKANQDLKGLLDLVQGKDLDMPRSALDHYRWTTGRDREFNIRVADYIRQRQN